MAKKREKEKRKKVFLTGDAPLVQEFSEVCAHKGYLVLVRAGIPLSLTTKAGQNLRTVREIPQEVSFALELTNINIDSKKKNLAALDRNLSAKVPILSTSITTTATEQTSWINRKDRLVGISGLPTFLGGRLLEVAPTLYTSTSTLSGAREFLWSLGLEISVVQDRIGMVLPRILCMLVNEAAFAIMEDVATPEDIDLATELGMNYPRGPIAWGDRIGFDQVVAVLSALHQDLGDDRYRIAPILKQLSHTGRFWQRTS